MAAPAIQAHHARSEPRDEVHFRMRAFGPDARSAMLLVVNLSSHGLMARTERDFAAGDRLRLVLPVIGIVAAEVRWSLGDRMGCEFDTGIDRASYFELLATVLKR